MYREEPQTGGRNWRQEMTKCELCGKEFMRHSPTQKFCCRECYKEFKLRQRPPGKRRFSGRSYKNSEQRLNELREKYKKGITAEIMQEFAENLQIPRDSSNSFPILRKLQRRFPYRVQI